MAALHVVYKIKMIKSNTELIVYLDCSVLEREREIERSSWFKLKYASY